MTTWRQSTTVLGVLLLCRLIASAAADEKTEGIDRADAAATREAERAIARMKVPDGLKIELFAAEPLLANPVAFCFDERGRIYVAETHRVGGGRGVEDNRGHMDWLDDDLAAQTVEDRVAYLKKHLGPRIAEYTKYSERIKRIEDTDGDGRADRAHVFADGFNDIADGTGAGVLARNGDVYYTCIPHLWKLRDNDGDGRADERKSLHYGYGVKFAFFGHDLHGLTIGPDGRLYFSIGDRGFNVKIGEHKEPKNPFDAGNDNAPPRVIDERLTNTDSGAVLRCELDGSNLEIFCKGLRNPQELVFDDYGNLFTCDNNSDSGDRARWTHLVEGADYGWRMYYQYLPDRGPWNREKLWYPQHEGQAAYIVPCIANVTDGPSGITYYPGTGLGDNYKGHFFVCDFRGTAANSCIYTWTVKPKGASFELVGASKFLEGMLATDCDFGPDGGLYVSDWIDGWNGLNKGRIYRVVNPAAADDPRVNEVHKLLSESFSKRSAEELVKLLGHSDRRVRLEAQFELVARREQKALLNLAIGTKQSKYARLHALWGVGQIIRLENRLRTASFAPTLQSGDDAARLATLLTDDDIDMAGHAALALADAGFSGFDEALAVHQRLPRLFARPSAEAKFHAATAGARIGGIEFKELLSCFEQVHDEDAVLRHAILRTMNRFDKARYNALRKSPSGTARLAWVLAERLDSIAADSLDDSDPRVALESARSIHDLPSDTNAPALMPQLATRIDKPYVGTADEYDALFRRVLNANFRLGKPEHAKALAKYAARKDAPENLQIEALDMLSSWARPSPRDRVLGCWRPLGERDGSVAADALRTQLAPIFSASATVRRKAAEVASKLGVKEVVPELVRLMQDGDADAPARAAALAALGQLKAGSLDEAVKTALADNAPELRIEGRRILAKRDPAAAIEELKHVLASGTAHEKQAAIETLATIPEPRADALLGESFGELIADRLAPELRLDLVTAVRDRLNRPNRLLTWTEREALRRQLQAYDEMLAKDASSAYRLAIAGGDAERGRTVFFEKTALSCVRCHKINDHGGEVGPDLSKIGADKKRDYLLESIVEPNKAIAKGFETVVITLDDGRSVSGIVKNQTDKELTLITAEAKIVTIPTAEILERTSGQSAMPADLVKQMSLSELRDLVEFLSSLR